ARKPSVAFLRPVRHAHVAVQHRCGGEDAQTARRLASARAARRQLSRAVAGSAVRARQRGIMPTPCRATCPAGCVSHSLSSPPGTIVIRLRSKERPMRRGPKSSKAKVESKRSAPPKSRKSESSGVQDLEKRLAEALQREADALEQLQTHNHQLVEAREQQTATSELLKV